MWDEIVKSVRAALYERTTSPLFGAYAVAWSVWNYKFLLTVFSELPIREKLDTFHVVFFPGVESYIYAFGIPLFGALLFIFVYPFPARWVYQFWRTQQKVLKEVRQKIDDETPLTKEEARELRHSLQRLEDEYQREVSHRNAEIQRLRDRIQQLQQLSTAEKPDNDVSPKQIAPLKLEDEFSPTDSQLQILKDISESKSGDLSRRDILGSTEQSVTKTEFDLGELMSNGLVQILSSGPSGPLYSVTHTGRKILVAKGLV